jgi:hypothetical protein
MAQTSHRDTRYRVRCRTAGRVDIEVNTFAGLKKYMHVLRRQNKKRSVMCSFRDIQLNTEYVSLKSINLEKNIAQQFNRVHSQFLNNMEQKRFGYGYLPIQDDLSEKRLLSGYLTLTLWDNPSGGCTRDKTKVISKRAMTVVNVYARRGANNCGLACLQHACDCDKKKDRHRHTRIANKLQMKEQLTVAEMKRVASTHTCGVKDVVIVDKLRFNQVTDEREDVNKRLEAGFPVLLLDGGHYYVVQSCGAVIVMLNGHKKINKPKTDETRRQLMFISVAYRNDTSIKKEYTDSIIQYCTDSIRLPSRSRPRH